MLTDSLSIGDRATISNMTPEFGATAGIFYIDHQTIDYLKLTGREPEQVALVESYAKTTGLWAEQMRAAEYECVREFDLTTVRPPDPVTKNQQDTSAAERLS